MCNIDVFVRSFLAKMCAYVLCDHKMSTTLLAKYKYCSWCGTCSASARCACGKVVYCDGQCQKKGWTEHRLICPAQKETHHHIKKEGLSFTNGDIVRIHSLMSETGQKMNGSLAEIVGFDKGSGRYQLLYTRDLFYIDSAKVKPQNLEMHLIIYKFFI